MSWLKNVVIDIAIAAVILLYALQGPQWAWWIIAIYTPLLLLLKISALATGMSQAVEAREGGAPDWFHHVIYAVSVLLLGYAAWWWAAGAWAAIWVVSIITNMKSRPKKRASNKEASKKGA